MELFAVPGSNPALTQRRVGGHWRIGGAEHRIRAIGCCPERLDFRDGAFSASPGENRRRAVVAVVAGACAAA